MNTRLPPPTYREIAKLTGFSVFSVSCALRNRPGVSEETRLLIRQTAEKLGYRPDPVVTALMAQRRTRSPRRQLRSIIACLVSAEIVKIIDRHSVTRLIFQGLRETCRAAGFIFEILKWEDFGESPSRLFASLRVRRVSGVIFFESVPDWCEQGWERYAMITVGNPQKDRLHHYVSANHHNNMWLAMNTLTELGYQRIGFAMSRTTGMRNNNQAVSSYQGWITCAGIANPPPILWVDQWEEKAFLNWIKKSRLDAIIAAEHEALGFLREAGFRLPEDIGFVHLSLDESWHDLAGIRQNSYHIGEATAHHVIDQINRNAYGLSSHPRSIQITGEWFAGPSVRKKG